MESGELEIRKAFEEVTTRNVRTVIDYSTETRNLLRELEKKIDLQADQLRSQANIIEDLRKLIASLQTKVFSGGTV